MSTSLRTSISLVLALMLITTFSGCGTSRNGQSQDDNSLGQGSEVDGRTGRGSPGQSGISPSATGAPIQPDGIGKVVVSPFNVPFNAVEAGNNYNYNSYKEMIEWAIMDACGGDLCLDHAARVDDDGVGEPCIMKTDPENPNHFLTIPRLNAPVKRRSTIYFVIDAPCDLSAGNGKKPVKPSQTSTSTPKPTPSN